MGQQPLALKRKVTLTDRRLYEIDDFNGDDKLDIAFVDRENLDIVVLCGNGDGTFGSEIIGLENDWHLAEAVEVRAADFNNDKQLDLVVLELLFGDVIVLLGNGNGTFRQNPMVLSSNRRSSALVVADLNEDALLDIIVPHPMSNEISVFLGEGNDSFESPRTLSVGLGSYPLRVTIADCNRDDHEDLVVVNNHGKTLAVLLGKGDGNFDEPKFSFTGGGRAPVDVVVDDFNSDELLDFVVSFAQDYVVVMFGLGDGLVGNSTKFHLGTLHREQPTFVSDFNGDGHADVAFGIDGQSMTALMGNGHGYFDLQKLLSDSFILQGTSVFGMGDFNGDGHEDLVSMELGDKTQHVLLTMCE